jgi:hypothetical protein
MTITAEQLEKMLPPCPFCGAPVPRAYENLKDDPEDEDNVITVWTIQHSCSVLRNDIWCEGADAAACEATWSGQPLVAEVERLREIVRDFLNCPEIADCAPDDKDPETNALERQARAALPEEPADG